MASMGGGKPKVCQAPKLFRAFFKGSEVTSDRDVRIKTTRLKLVPLHC